MQENNTHPHSNFAQTSLEQAPQQRTDKFVQGLKERLPVHLKDSFTPDQLAALQLIFGARAWGRHTLDYRTNLTFWRKRYYLILLAGHSSSAPTRNSSEVSLFLKAFITGLLMLCSLVAATVLVVLVLYLMKSALNINYLPDFSFGVWDSFKDIL
ncbi:hypothetical protein IQ22_01550 [Pseudomonas duriflava]|uniref:3-phosphoshikimate 1-carboxyvinyltransferase n=1 Tax=Pseudomonas duriflava TaxID=459528 RepID=A0A562QFV4_9PSED|nr:3-phosphoshikimate 1-carboxyvinyltransferase [Pseudomonas duriflava]TWI55624.1 hypothetical protein IQ22_01550 [Pseudomonas duriflava]